MGKHTVSTRSGKMLFSVENFDKRHVRKKIGHCHLVTEVVFGAGSLRTRLLSEASDKCPNDGLTNILQDLMVKQPLDVFPMMR